MPIAQSPSPVDADTDPFATQVYLRRSVPSKAQESPEARAVSGTNPLIAEADPLLELMPQLRSTVHIADVSQLRTRIGGLLQHFDERLRGRGVAVGQGQKAHFVLCALIDEVVETMPWGASGRWERLNPIHVAVGARPGDAAIRQFAQLAEDRAATRDLRELIYMALQ